MNGTFQKAFGFIIIFYFLNSSAYSYSGGTGDVNNPYQIANVADWLQFMNTSLDWNKNFVMVSDVNLQGIALTPINGFSGTFDGAKYMLSNIIINLPNTQNVGVFGSIYNAVIKNLYLEDVNIIGGRYVGGLVGYIGAGSNEILDCAVKGFVSVVSNDSLYSSCVGGLVGFSYYSNCTIKNCYTEGSVLSSVRQYSLSAYCVSGGLVGDMSSDGLVANCYSTCNVFSSSISQQSNAYSYAGGLVGKNGRGLILSCYSTGVVSAYSNSSPSGFYTYSYAGGLVGRCEWQISNCYSSSAVNSSAISGYTYAGGLVGIVDRGAISNCYSTGHILSSSNHSYAGGLIGKNDYSHYNVKACFWDVETSGQITSAGGTGKTTAAMKILPTFKNAGWYISDINGTDTLWIMMQDNQDYPKITYFFYNDKSQTIPFIGDGTKQFPYQIWSSEDFVNLSKCGSVWDKNITLMTDIYIDGLPIYPIGNSKVNFTGSFDGQGFTIRNAKINLLNKNIVGLFGYVGTNGEIKNLNIESANIEGKKIVGGLVGLNKGLVSNCDITGSIASLNSSCVGGLVGLNQAGMVLNCISNSNVNGYGAFVGGLIGYNSNSGLVSNCYSAGEITDTNPNDLDSYTGGLIGNNLGAIDNCNSAANVTAVSLSSYICVGGMTGNDGGAIVRSFANGDVTANSTLSDNVCLGGLSGLKCRGSINSCYATGNLLGSFGDKSNYYMGGLIGLNWVGIITNCYSSTALNFNTSNEYRFCIGGFLGLNLDGDVFASFYDTQKSGMPYSAGGQGLSTEQMQSMIFFQNAGWKDKGWVINETVDYPHLEWEGTDGIPILEAEPVPLSGSGTEADPYQIWTTEDFLVLNSNINILDKYINLMADLDLSGISFYPIGEHGAFTGNFNGNGHIIKKINIFQPINSCVGLFSKVVQNGVIQNLNIEDVNIAGMNYVGGLIGKSQNATVVNCMVSGSVAGVSYTGGLIGKNDYSTVANCHSCGNMTGIVYTGGLIGGNESGTVSNCSSMGYISMWDCDYDNYYAGGLIGYDVNSKIYRSFSSIDINSTRQYNSYAYIGGLVGYSRKSIISNCHAVGSTSVSSSKAFVGGFIGYNYGATISNCYSTGKVENIASGAKVGGLIGFGNGQITKCFWDKQTSGKTTSAGGTGKTTAEMKTLLTFTNAGWDFMYESVNGSNDIWRMCSDGVDYPRLGWEYSSHGDFDCPDGTDIGDLSVFSDQWLLEEGYVNFIDFAGFADSWDGDTTKLYNFAEQWLQPLFYAADIAPWGGDGVVNILDFAVFAEYWVGN